MKNFGRNIVPLKPGQSHGTEFPVLAQVEGYWRGICRGASLPQRRDIDPRGMESALAHVFLLERIAPGVFRFRIAGQHMNDLMGLDVGGMPVTTLFTVEGRKEISRIAETVCAEPCIKLVNLSGEKSLGRGTLDGQMFLAPMLDETGQVMRILGCLQATGSIGRQPRRFSVTDVHTKFLNAPQPAARPTPQMAGIAEKQAQYAPAGTSRETGQPVLQLVVSND